MKLTKEQQQEKSEGKTVTPYERVTNHNAVEYFMFGMPFQYWKGMAFCAPDCKGLRGSEEFVCTRHRQAMSLYSVHTDVQMPAPSADEILGLRRNVYVYGLPKASALNQGIVSFSYTALKDMQDQTLDKTSSETPADKKMTTEEAALDAAKKKQPAKGLEQFAYSKFYQRATIDDNIISRVWDTDMTIRKDAVKFAGNA